MTWAATLIVTNKAHAAAANVLLMYICEHIGLHPWDAMDLLRDVAVPNGRARLLGRLPQDPRLLWRVNTLCLIVQGDRALDPDRAREAVRNAEGMIWINDIV